ncbi:MAG: filamentous hemagglutinin N-terminal domain-containing protein, partial [Rhodocyclaceae bacterium]|nr:filamentous hemagglutinin N-terminal domain-containing protein [Rhodocyclaceae bacterium]
LGLALIFAGAGAAHAGPAGPVVSAGRASYDPATLTVISTTGHTQIGWQSFHVGVDEVVNFIQPNAQSSVLNQIFNPQSMNIMGSLRSNGSVLFMSNGRVSGAGLNLDLAGMISTSLRLPHMALAQSGNALPAQPLTSLADGGVYVISQDEQALTTVKGDVLLNPGRTVELAHASTPALRVVLTAPDAEAINLSRLVGGKRETGIFAGLFPIPAAARQAAQAEAGTVSTAAAAELRPDTPELGRSYRYALLYAQMRRETPQHEGGMMRVAVAPTDRIMLPAVKSRSSVLPRDIEIGVPALRTREPAATPSRLPAPAASEQGKKQNKQYEQKDRKEPLNQLAMAPELRPVPATAQNAAAGAMRLTLAPLAAEVMANLEAQPISVAPEAEPIREPTSLLALASAEPPAEMAATRSPQSTMLAFASAEPPAEMAAVRSPQPIALAFASAEPPAVAVAAPASRAIRVADGSDAEATSPRTSQTPRPSPAVMVVALAQHSVASAPHEDAPAKEVRIERRAPRYFTDFRGAMFFM